MILRYRYWIICAAHKMRISIPTACLKRVGPSRPLFPPSKWGLSPWHHPLPQPRNSEHSGTLTKSETTSARPTLKPSFLGPGWEHWGGPANRSFQSTALWKFPCSCSPSDQNVVHVNDLCSFISWRVWPVLQSFLGACKGSLASLIILWPERILPWGNLCV